MSCSTNSSVAAASAFVFFVFLGLSEASFLGAAFFVFLTSDTAGSTTVSTTVSTTGSATGSATSSGEGSTTVFATGSAATVSFTFLARGALGFFSATCMK